MTQEKFYKNLLDKPIFIDGFASVVASDVLDQSDFWSDDPDEFFNLFQACAKTQAGKEFILFLVGHNSMTTYLETVTEELGVDIDNDDEEDGI